MLEIIFLIIEAKEFLENELLWKFAGKNIFLSAMFPVLP